MHDLVSHVGGDRCVMKDILAHFCMIEPLFDAMPDVVFFVKDNEARYLLANQTLAHRCGFKSKHSLIGQTAAQVFLARFGIGFTEQDESVLHL
jgi:hypothetical protein